MNRRILILVVLGVASLIYPLVIGRVFFHHMAILVFMYAIMGLGWNFVGGYTGQVALGQAIFFGAGAYTSTVLLQRYGISPWLGLIAGGLVAVVLSVLIGGPTFRLVGHYFAIATLALGEIAAALVRRWEFLGGARGLHIQIREESLLDFQFHTSKVPYYYIILIILAITILVSYLVQRSKWGFSFLAIKGDPVAAASIGINVPMYKLIAFALSAFFTAVAGTFYAQYVLYIDPDSVLLMALSLQMAFVVILGGAGTITGPILGAAVLIILSQVTRSYLGGGSQSLHLLIYGTLIVVMAVFEPRGLVALVKRVRWGGTDK